MSSAVPPNVTFCSNLIGFEHDAHPVTNRDNVFLGSVVSPDMNLCMPSWISERGQAFPTLNRSTFFVRIKVAANHIDKF